MITHAIHAYAHIQMTRLYLKYFLHPLISAAQVVAIVWVVFRYLCGRG